MTTPGRTPSPADGRYWCVGCEAWVPNVRPCRHLTGLADAPLVDMTEVVHFTPRRGDGKTPCCDKTPFELPRTDRMTLDPRHVTCTGRTDV